MGGFDDAYFSLKTVHVRCSALPAIKQHTRRGYPREVAGILSLDRDGNTLDAAGQAAASTDRLSISRARLAEAYGALADRGLACGGPRRSLPDSWAYPTDADRRLRNFVGVRH